MQLQGWGGRIFRFSVRCWSKMLLLIGACYGGGREIIESDDVIHLNNTHAWGFSLEFAGRLLMVGTLHAKSSFRLKWWPWFLHGEQASLCCFHKLNVNGLIVWPKFIDEVDEKIGIHFVNTPTLYWNTKILYLYPVLSHNLNVWIKGTL